MEPHDIPDVLFSLVDDECAAVLTARGSIDFRSAGKLAEELLAVPLTRPVVVDLGAVEATDSRVLEELVEDARRRRGALHVVCSSRGTVYESFESAANTRALPRYTSRAAAIAAARKDLESS